MLRGWLQGDAVLCREVAPRGEPGRSTTRVSAGGAGCEAAEVGADHGSLPSPAPLSTVLSNRFGHRLVVMAGGLLVSAGMVIASFARGVVDMYITIGIVSGECPSCLVLCSIPPARLPTHGAAAPPELVLRQGWAPGSAFCPVLARAPARTQPCAHSGLGSLGRTKLCPASNPLTLPLSLFLLLLHFPRLQPRCSVNIYGQELALLRGRVATGSNILSR